MADSFELAFYKAQEAAQQLLPQSGTVLISVSDPDKPEALDVAREFIKLGFKIKATEGRSSTSPNTAWRARRS